MNRPTITVIVPVKNAAKFIATALQSVYSQTYAPFEVIVINDHSTDNTMDIVKSKFPEVICIESNGHGVASARNAGFAAAKGQYIANIDADDSWLPNKLELQVSHLDEHTVVSCQAQNFRIVQKETVDIGNPFPAIATKTLIEFYAYGYGIPGSSWIIPKSIVAEIGGMDEAFTIGSDSDFFGRALAHGYKLDVLVDVLARRLLHDNNLYAKSYFSGFRMSWSICKKYVQYGRLYKLPKLQAIKPNELLSLVLFRFIMRGISDVSQRRTSVWWYPYLLIGMCITRGISTPRVWLGVVQIAINLRHREYRDKISHLVEKWRNDFKRYAQNMPK